MSMPLILGLVAISLAMSVQAAHTVYLMLYSWNQSEAHEATRAPRRFRESSHSFTVLLPARHEEAVIGATIARVLRANYPAHLLEVLVVCDIRDIGTIEAAQAAIQALSTEALGAARVITFNDGPINKPHSLNKGLGVARHQVITIFDAEDEIHPEIFNLVNTVMLDEGVRVVQGGLQLMNYNSTWFAAHNVLEYYFWFKSRLQAYVKTGMTPLGGNTIFFSTDLVRSLGGWDERNLTEDADIGIRLCAQGERVRVIYDDAYVTKEETPPTLGSFIRQRTRWNQGFLQTLRKGSWRSVPTLSNRFRALYILAFPFVQAILALYMPLSLLMIVTVKLPVLVTLILFLPSYFLAAHWLLGVVGLYLFAHAHQVKLPRYSALLLLVTFFPYLWVLSYAALRAIWRESRSMNNWEKTDHLGAHRQPVPGREAGLTIPLAPQG